MFGPLGMAQQSTSPVTALGPPPGPGSAALQNLQLDVERLIDAYELDVVCHGCQSVHKCAIGWLRVHSTMQCATCQSSIVLRTSLMNEEMRRVARPGARLLTLPEEAAVLLVAIIFVVSGLVYGRAKPPSGP